MMETVAGFFLPPFSFPSIGSQTANLLIQKRLIIGPNGPKSYTFFKVTKGNCPQQQLPFVVLYEDNPLYQMFMLSMFPEICVLFSNVPPKSYPNPAKVQFIGKDSALAIV